MSHLYEIYACITVDHDMWTLLAAVFLCCIGGIATFALWDHVPKSQGRRRQLLFTLAVLTAACAVWTTHFVAMLGYVRGLDREISVAWTVWSLALAIVLYAGATLALLRAHRSLAAKLAAGLALTAAVGVMHYTGIQAFRQSADLIWNLDYVALSLALSAAFNLAAVLCFTRVSEALRGIGTPLFFSVSIISLHFTGMTGLTILPFTASDAAGSAVWLTPVLMLAVVVIALGGAVAIAFDRFAAHQQALEADRLRQLTDKLRRANEELVVARDQAEQGARSKSRFLASMSHEIRTPMNGVLGMAEILSATSLTADQRECVSVIQSSGSALLGLIEDILDISRLEQAAPTFSHDRFDLRDLLEEIAILTTPLAEAKALKLHLHYAAAVPRHLIGDKGRIRQVLLNLLGNAIKFTDRGHVLIDVSPQAPGAPLAIQVIDTGIGIEGDHVGSVFDPFHQAEISHLKLGGTGLGLTISRTLARQMGGDLIVQSRVGQGSTFTLTLVAEHWTLEALPDSRAAGSRVAVLAADPLERQILCDMVRQCGAEAVSVPDRAGLGAEIAAGRVSGAILCQDTAAPPPSVACPTLIVAPSSQLSETAGPAGEIRVLRPLRLGRLAEWLAAPGQGRAGAHSAYVCTGASAAARGGDRPCILVVDDNKVNRLVVRRMLETEGFDFLEAEDGSEACAICAAQKVSHVFMDVSMPVMDGLDATAEIRRSERLAGEPPVRIIGLTAHASQDDHVACVAVGMDEVATKPVSKAKLLSLLRIDAPEVRSAA